MVRHFSFLFEKFLRFLLTRFDDLSFETFFVPLFLYFDIVEADRKQASATEGLENVLDSGGRNRVRDRRGFVWNDKRPYEARNCKRFAETEFERCERIEQRCEIERLVSDLNFTSH